MRDSTLDDIAANTSVMIAQMEVVLAMRAASDVVGLLYGLKRAAAYWRAISATAAELVAVEAERLSALRQLKGERRSPAMSEYPPDYWDWSESRREEFLRARDQREKEAADGQRARRKDGNGAAGTDAAPHDECEPRESAQVIDLAIARLAKLREVEYEQKRKEAASQLSVRTSVLDKLVAAARPPDESKPGSGRALKLEQPEAWPEFVNGAALLSEIADAIRKYVVLSKADADTVALWCLHTFAFEPFSCTPRLAITSPEKRCGKTTLLDVIERLVAQALQTANISAAAVFRTVEITKPTLIIDEADTFLDENEELRRILNSDHRKGGQVIRTVGDDHEPRAFSTRSPCAIAMIGKLPDTLADRSVAVSLKRRLPSEPISSFRGDRVDALKVLARKAVRWTEDNSICIGDADPELPDGLFNRTADNWRPLFGIAAVAGGDWPERVKNAASAQMGVQEEESLKEQLLADVHDAFAGKDRISSDDLVAYLVSLEEWPWCEISHGKPMTKNQLARRLKPLG